MKFNKKGFTLIELLAVIAILAILVVIAVPNILQLFNNARKGTFVTQAQSIYKGAQNNRLSTFTTSSDNITSYYSSASSTDSGSQRKLKLDGDNTIAYCIKFSNDGLITYFHVSNSNYSIEIPTNTSGINISDITSDSLKTNNVDTGTSGYKAVSSCN